MHACRARFSRETLEKQSSFIKPPLTILANGPDHAQAPDNTGEKQAKPALGMGHAFKNRISSEAPFPARGWGGARNSSSRTSDSLSLNQAAKIIEAAKFAVAIGLPFNRMVTIHWEKAGIPDERAARATGRFLKLAGDWNAKRGGRIAWAWVRENGDGKGSHVHILLHLPANKITGKKRERLGDMQRRWLRSIAGAPYRAGTINTRRIGSTARAAQTAPAAYHANLVTVTSYVLKGSTPQARAVLGIWHNESGGRIIGRRCSTSQNIGRAARSRAQLDNAIRKAQSE